MNTTRPKIRIKYVLTVTETNGDTLKRKDILSVNSSFRKANAHLQSAVREESFRRTSGTDQRPFDFGMTKLEGRFIDKDTGTVVSYKVTRYQEDKQENPVLD